MRLLHALIAVSMSALSQSTLAQASADAKGDANQTSAAADGVIDELVIREMLAHGQGLTEADLREGLRHCDGTTVQMKICAAYRWTAQDVRLERLYAKGPRAPDGVGALPSLAKARQAWIAWRDAQCAFEGEQGAGGGTMEGLYVLACKEALTRQQADRLEQVDIR